jgi:SNF2-related domain/Chromo (CHRromatin Organisation MOdifier) domain
MSKQFERLYHAWVLEFRERYVRWADPRARPWEHSCRVHDGKCGTSDDKMVLCDHCDAMYGFQCVTPPLSKVPNKAWHCPDCRPKLKSTKGVRMLSAVAEYAARKRAELGDIPKKKITKTMYLVKWAGLGYEFCTWETKDDIGNDSLVAEFHKINHGGFADEADLPVELIEEFLHSSKHVNVLNAGGLGVVPLLRSQLYAQSRGMEFLKFGIDIPDSVGREMGPVSTAAHRGPRVSMQSEDGENIEDDSWHPREVVECLSDIVFRVARQQKSRASRSHTLLPPPLTGEYDAIIPITAKGLMMNVGEMHGSVAFLGYRQFADGTKGPAELTRVVRSVGDKIIAVDGISTVGKSFQDVINMLRDSGKNKFAYMRFLETRYSACDSNLVSSGAIGSYAYEELQKKFMTDRQRVLVHRKIKEIEEDLEATGEQVKKVDSDEESEAGSEGSFEPDTDDDELVGTVGANEVSPATKKKGESENPKYELTNEDDTPKKEQSTRTPVVAFSDKVSEDPEKTAEIVISYNEKDAIGETPFILSREETTRSLALRLLDVDLGYSSDEAGDEDCAFFADGVDETFSNRFDLEDIFLKRSKDKKSFIKFNDTVVPANKTEFSALGERGKLVVAVALSTKPPSSEDYENFPAVDVDNEDAVESSTNSKSMKRSTVKVEQIDASSGEGLHVWANVEVAAATLQLPLPALRQVLRGEYDEDIGEEVGGFRWRYAASGAKVTAGMTQSRGGGQKKAKEAWLEFRDKLYDPSEPHHYKNGNRLRDYQVDGVNWLASMWYKRQGCILADEMGLGKTVQIVCYIEHLFRVEKIRRPFLVVVPLSTVEHWRREFEGWSDMVCCVYHDRQRVWRDVMREYEWYYEDRPHNCDFLKFDVLVTTYDTLIGDFDVIGQIPFRVAVVDEAHRLRNQKGKLLECMREISAKGTMQYGFQSRVLMSGTPLQNDLTELWTLLNFIEPFKFSDLDSFQVSFGNMANKGQVEALQSMISPYMLRRVKEDVAKDIPAKEETVIDVEMTSFQKQYYRAIFEHNHSFLNIGATRNTAPKLMNIQMELRKVCNHPFLLDGVEHRETERQFKEYLDIGAFEGKTPEQQQHMLNEHGYIMTSGKSRCLSVCVQQRCFAFFLTYFSFTYPSGST